MAIKSMKYKVSDGLVCNIKLDDREGLKDAYQGEPADAMTHSFHILQSKNVNQFGIQPRQVIWRHTTTVGAPPNERSATVEIIAPVLDPAKWDAVRTVAVPPDAQGQGGQEPSKITVGGIEYSAARKIDQRYV